jgi:hypothetical protein
LNNKIESAIIAEIFEKSAPTILSNAPISKRMQQSLHDFLKSRIIQMIRQSHKENSCFMKSICSKILLRVSTSDLDELSTHKQPLLQNLNIIPPKPKRIGIRKSKSINNFNLILHPIEYTYKKISEEFNKLREDQEYFLKSYNRRQNTHYFEKISERLIHRKIRKSIKNKSYFFKLV